MFTVWYCMADLQATHERFELLWILKYPEKVKVFLFLGLNRKIGERAVPSSLMHQTTWK